MVAKTQSSTKTAGKPLRRELSDGHMDPRYVADLLAKSGADDGHEETRAFLRRARSSDPLAEELGEGFLQSVTTGDDNDQQRLDPDNPEEEGGPFVETSAADEFGYEPDESNPEDAEPAPFPTTQSSS